jgi:hypothetical protein
VIIAAQISYSEKFERLTYFSDRQALCLCTLRCIPFMKGYIPAFSSLSDSGYAEEAFRGRSRVPMLKIVYTPSKPYFSPLITRSSQWNSDYSKNTWIIIIILDVRYYPIKKSCAANHVWFWTVANHNHSMAYVNCQPESLRIVGLNVGNFLLPEFYSDQLN